MFEFLKAKPLLDEETVFWLFDTYAWAIRHFNAHSFFNETELVTPSNQHFPGQGNTGDEMARIIFENVKRHAGVSAWPTQVVNENDITEVNVPKLEISGALRGNDLNIANVQQKFIIPYNETALRDPQILIANYAHVVAHYLGSMAPEPPPGGEENWPHVTEVLAVVLGFGLIMANTAFTVKIRSCGSCAGPAIERTNYLSQYDITYALAIFCALKGIDNKSVSRHLKKTLYPFYKKAIKEILLNNQALEKIKSINVNTLMSKTAYS